MPDENRPDDPVETGSGEAVKQSSDSTAANLAGKPAEAKTEKKVHKWTPAVLLGRRCLKE
jgi:hypothetical protein